MDTSVESFHEMCIAAWDCYYCPVCYYIKNPEEMNNSPCMKCDSADSRPCLICGRVSCSRNDQDHALEHYFESKHRYAMELGNFKVWDYKYEIFVHTSEDNQESGPPTLGQIIQNPKLVTNILSCGLWACLQCNHVGCGRLGGGYALQRSKTRSSITCDNYAMLVDCIQHKYLNRSTGKDIGVYHVNKGKEMDFDKRMNRLENEWDEFYKFTETNEKILTIEQRLIMLINEKKVLEGKLQEHDTKLNELITQFFFVGNQENALAKAPLNNLNLRPKFIVIDQSSANQSNDIFENTQHISVIIIILFLYHLVMLFL